MAPRFLLGAELSFEAELALRALPGVADIAPVLDVAVDHLGGEQPSARMFRQLQHATALESKTLGALFSGLQWIVRACVQSNLKAKALVPELTELKITPAHAQQLIAAVEKGRSMVHQETRVNDLGLPGLQDLRWRLDVSISTSALHRVLRPELTMQCTLSDNSVQTFHVSKQHFNDLRLTTATLLKELNDLEVKLPPQP